MWHLPDYAGRECNLGSVVFTQLCCLIPAVLQQEESATVGSKNNVKSSVGLCEKKIFKI